MRSDEEQTSTPEPHTGLQGEGGACRRQGRPDDSSACRAVRRPPQSDYGVEGAAGGWCFRSFWTWQRCAGHACDRCEVAACQDRGADAGERFFRRSAHQGGIAADILIAVERMGQDCLARFPTGTTGDSTKISLVDLFGLGE